MAVKEPCGCGFGKKRPLRVPKKKNAMGVGNQKQFYKNGADNALFLTPVIKQCLNIIYSPEMRYGGAHHILLRS